MLLIYICIVEGQVWRDPIGFFEAGAASAYGIVELGVDSSFWWSTRSIDANSRSIGSRGRSLTTFTKLELFWPPTYLPPRGHFSPWTRVKMDILDKNGHFWTTYQPHFVHVVIERPLGRGRERGGHENRWTLAKRAGKAACRTTTYYYSTQLSVEPCCISAIN
jgi:hypothetical protein